MSTATPSESSEPQRLRFAVEGMHCASCVSRLDAALRDHPGVRAVAVNLAREEARVVTTDAATDPAELIRRATEAGYTLRRLDDRARDSHSDSTRQFEARTLRRSAAAAGLLSAPVVVLAMGGIETAWSLPAQALLTAPVVFAFGARFHRSGLARLARGAPDMDSLVSLGTLAAYGASLSAWARGGPVYFESAAVIVTLILIGRSLEARAKGQAAQAVARFARLRADDAVVLRGGEEQRIPIDALEAQDEIVLQPGSLVPADAIVVEGQSEVDESWLSGEALPVAKAAGSLLHAGTVNGNGRLVARTTQVGEGTLLSRIEARVDEAQAAKAPIERLVDKVAGIFVPAVLAVAVLTFVGWTLAGTPAVDALRHAVAVLVIACPCALGLATPTAVMVGSGRGAELGVLFRDAEVFEVARHIDCVAFDKTGTLTRGELRVSAVHTAKSSGEPGVGEPDIGEPDVGESELLAMAASAETGSEHPIARAVVAAARERGLRPTAPQSLAAEPGRGVRARIANPSGGTTEVLVGRRDWIEEQGLRAAPSLARSATEAEAAGATAFAVAYDGSIRGFLAVEDTLRDSAARTIRALHDKGITTLLLSGDSEPAVRAVAARVGITRFRARRLPEQKGDDVAAEQARGARVAFVGDGINDAVALARADLGVAVGDASAIASDAAGIVLLGGDPLLVPRALELARRTFRTIAQNLFWAFAYNTAALPLAAFGYLDPMIAAGAMALSSVSVVTNSLRLRTA